MVDNNWTVKVKIWKGRFAKSCMYLPQPWPQEVTPASSGASPSPRGQTSGPPLSPATQVMSTVRLLPEHESLPSSPAHNMSSLIRKPYLGIVQTYSVQALVVRFLASFLLSNTHSSVHKVSPTTGRDTWYRKLWTNSCLLRQTGLPSQYFCYFGWVWQILNERQACQTNIAPVYISNQLRVKVEWLKTFWRMEARNMPPSSVMPHLVWE